MAGSPCGFAAAEECRLSTSAPTLTQVEAEDIPIAYLPGHALRVRVKVVGNIAAAWGTGADRHPR